MMVQFIFPVSFCSGDHVQLQQGAIPGPSPSAHAPHLGGPWVCLLQLVERALLSSFNC